MLNQFFVTWNKIRALPPFEILWALPAWLLLGLARFVVLLVPFRRLAPFLGIAVGSDPWLPTLTPEQELRAWRIARVVYRSTRFTPWTSNCYDQAITARVLLGLYHIPYALFLGVRRGDADRPLDAHAWVASGRMRVTGGSSFEQYAVVSCFVAPGLLPSPPHGALADRPTARAVSTQEEP